MTNKNVENPYTDPETGKFLPGNPGGGRPEGAGISITTEIKRKLAEVSKYSKDKKTNLQLLLEVILEKAIKSKDQQTIKQIWNYLDGLPQAKIDHTTAGKELPTPIYGGKSTE